MENKQVYGWIYLITNLFNGKQYVGQTTIGIEKRFKEHCNKYKKTIITKAIKKYGKENFTIKVLGIAYNQEQLNFSEGFYINYFKTLKPNGYNLTNIINGKGKLSEETIEKMRIKHKTPERLKWASENGKKQRGKSLLGQSKYCGVSRSKNKWRSSYTINRKSIHLGLYNSEVEAAKAHDIEEIKYFGKDAILNFPELREDYINNIIFIKKCSKHDNSKSGIKGVSFDKQKNKWYFRWFDINLNKRRCKHFQSLEDAIEYSNSFN